MSGRIGFGREAREGFLEEVTKEYSLKDELGADLAQREGRVHNKGKQLGQRPSRSVDS